MKQVKVQMYEAFDGRLYGTEAECLAYEAGQKLRNLVSELRISSGGTWDGSMVSDVILENRVKFIEALGGVA